MTFEQRLRLAEKHLSGKDKRLVPIIESSGPCRIRPHRDHYGELVGSIVGQQLSAAASGTIWRRVLDIFNGSMPTPEQLMKVDDQKLRDVGLSWAKVGYVKDLARHIIDGRLDLDHISTMPNEQLIEQLTAVKGIGEWSAHMFMMFGFGYPADRRPWHPKGHNGPLRAEGTSRSRADYYSRRSKQVASVRIGRLLVSMAELR